MDRKLILVTVLGVLVAGLIAALVLVLGNMHMNRSYSVGDLMIQEKQYQNENYKSLFENDADYRFQKEPRQSRIYTDRAFRKALLNYEAGLYREAPKRLRTLRRIISILK